MNDDNDDRKSIRVDLQLIADMIEPNTRVLDAGCGNGTLLDYLGNFKQVDGRGIEISTEGVNACVSAGLSVIQGDVEADLKDYPDKSFDYVVLSQTLQAMRDPKEVLHQLTRIGNRAIISFPNFGYWRYRLYILLKGRMPVSETIPYQWYDTPNIHFCTIRDFQLLAEEMGLTIEKKLFLGSTSQFFANLFSAQAVYILKK